MIKRFMQVVYYATGSIQRILWILEKTIFKY